EIVRSRESGSPKLEIRVIEDGTESVICKSSVADTQTALYNILGLNETEIRQSVYFSAVNPVLYGDLGGSARVSLFSRLVHLDEVTELADLASSDLQPETSTSISIK